MFYINKFHNLKEVSEFDEEKIKTQLEETYSKAPVIKYDNNDSNFDAWKAQFLVLLEYYYNLDKSKFKIFEDLGKNVLDKLLISSPLHDKKAMARIKDSLENVGPSIKEHAQSSQAISDSYTVNACFEGAASNIDDLILVYFKPRSLNNILVTARNHAIKQLALEFSKDAGLLEKYGAGNEIHIVNGLFNIYAAITDFPISEDVFIPKDIPYLYYDSFLEYIDEKFSFKMVIGILKYICLQYPLPDLNGINSSSNSLELITAFFSQFENINNLQLSKSPHINFYWERLYICDEEFRITPRNNIVECYFLYLVELLLRENFLTKEAVFDHSELIFSVIENGQIETLNEFIKAHVDITNLSRKDGVTPLHIAAQYGHKEIVEMLLDHKANPDIIRKDGMTPLHIAVQDGNKEIVEMLLHHKASPNIFGVDGMTLLHIAVQYGNKEMVSMLLDHKANPNIFGVDGMTPLHIAVQDGNKEIVGMLLDHQADPNISGVDGMTPFYLAARGGNKEIVGMLLDHEADPNISTVDGVTPFYIAAQNGHKKIIEMLLDHKADVHILTKDGGAPLHIAAQKGHKEIVGILLDQKADPNILAKEGATPLHLATLNGHTEIARMLLNQKADPSISTKDGVTSIHLAAQHGRTEIVKMLLEKNVDFNIPCDGMTSIQIARKCGHIEIVNLIREAMDLEKRNKELLAQHKKALSHEIHSVNMLIAEASALEKEMGDKFQLASHAKEQLNSA